ncbi:MAG TPA: NAD-dependent epimerase/dehydratase family protein [Acidimicrobiia bacterium]|nr:NAD-dependent epimerase/dehydratase family protein [Acidimicrobiia bacterium]
MVAAQPATVLTGADGWLGQNLVRALVRDPARPRIRCLVRDAGDAARVALLDRRIEVVGGDVRDPVVIDRLFDGLGPVSVFHAAAVIHPRRHVRECFDVNVGGTQLVLDRARRVGARRFVYFSSNSPFGANRLPRERFEEESPYAPYLAYGQSKLEAEQIVQRAGARGDLATVILRPPWFYGPFQPARQTQFFRAVRRGRFPLVGSGEQQRSMVYTENLVDAALLAEQADAAVGQAFWIADAEPYPLVEIIRTVREALSAEAFEVGGRQLRVPRLAGTFAEQLDRVVQATGRYVQPLHVLGELKDTIACDITKARKELGYEPKVALYDGMRASIQWCKREGLL